jgi:hypothetical protein
MIFALEISAVSLYAWIKEGLPVIRQNPYIFTDKSLDWIVKNKPNYAKKAKKLEG